MLQGDMTEGLNPLPYHRAMRDYLQREEAGLWRWFSSNRVRAEAADAVRLDLLKTTYRVDRETQPALYELADRVVEKLAFEVPVTIYQSQSGSDLNASLAYIPSEAHLVLSGPVASTLTAPELEAVFGHELSHLLLWEGWNGDYMVADQLLGAMSMDAHADTAHIESIRLFRLYTEVFCDRGALRVAGETTPVVSALVKMHTGIAEVSAESYLRQAEEIFSQGPVKAQELTHPEVFIRARAIERWSANDEEADAIVAEMIEGAPALDTLDLLARTRVAANTRVLIGRLLSPEWFRTEATLAHTRLYFDDFDPEEGTAAPAPDEPFDHGDDALKDYYCFVLLDFVSADRDLEELPLAAAIVLAREVGLADQFRTRAMKDLRIRALRYDDLASNAPTLLSRAARDETAS
jgi:hypothetical protein